MSRTRRKRFDGVPMRDGDHGKKCPSANCNVCGSGFYKKILRRLSRRTGERKHDG